MAKINTAKSGKNLGNRYLTMDANEYSGDLRKAIDTVFELSKLIQEAKEEAIRQHDKVFPKLANNPISFKWGSVSVALDETRTKEAAKGSLTLADFVANMQATGRRV